MKLTKIIATIGPSCETPEQVQKLISKGVNVFRFNFKHNTVEWHAKRIQTVKDVAAKLNLPIGTLIDLQGPEIRINMPYDDIRIDEGKEYLFGPDKEIAITHNEIYEYLEDGQLIIADDGAFRFTLHKKGKQLILKSHSEGILKNKKTLNIPGADLPVSSLVDRDLEGIALAKKHDIDFIALSFVRTADDITFLRSQLHKLKSDAKIVSKIETQKAIKNLNEIIKESDIVMVARGDLGVEFPLEEVPFYQKKIIKECLGQGVPVIIATQMLESMIENPYPTRAEISDIANATYDLTDAVMLSAESAVGKYPSKAVSTMARTVRFSETASQEDVRFRHAYGTGSQAELICDAAYNLYYKYKKSDAIVGFVIFTQTGKTARTLSRYRPHVPIFTFTPTEAIASSLSIDFGIYPYVSSATPKKGVMDVRREKIREAVKFLQKEHKLPEGKKMIALYGDVWGTPGGVTTIKILTV